MNEKNIYLNETHVALGAKMVPFAGFVMPVSYSSVTEEHLTVRNNVGMFDVSHMGQFIVEGSGSLDLLQKLTTNDVSVLEVGKAQYSCMLNNEGGIIDDLLIYKLEGDKYMMVVNAGNIERDWKWVQANNQNNVKLTNLSDDVSLLAIQGPKAMQVLQQLTALDLSTIPYYTFKIAEIAGASDVNISATGYTGAGGFELYIKNKYVQTVWEKILEAGQEFGIKPVGLAARDTLRLEMGFCLHGNDIDETTTPLEAGLGWVTKFNNSFIGSEQLQKQKSDGIARKLVGFKILEKRIPRAGYLIKNENNQDIGAVTSGTISPILKHGIGMGYVQKDNAIRGNEIFIEIRNKQYKAEIVKAPFIK